MIRIKNVSKLRIYLNTAPLKTAAEVREATGADAVCNLQLYDMSTFKPCCHMVVDGIVPRTNITIFMATVFQTQSLFPRKAAISSQKAIIFAVCGWQPRARA